MITTIVFFDFITSKILSKIYIIEIFNFFLFKELTIIISQIELMTFI